MQKWTPRNDKEYKDTTLEIQPRRKFNFQQNAAKTELWQRIKIRQMKMHQKTIKSMQLEMDSHRETELAKKRKDELHRILKRRLSQKKVEEKEVTMKRRSGKWGAVEEEFAVLLIKAFMNGILNLQGGCSLRQYLATQLHCSPMRVTKKLGYGQIGGVAVPLNVRRHRYKHNLEWSGNVQQEILRLKKARADFWKFMGWPVPDHKLDVYPKSSRCAADALMDLASQN